MSTKRDHKPNKPYPSILLTPHLNGQCCKKIRGKLHFFGTWTDPKAARDRFLARLQIFTPAAHLNQRN